MTLSAAFNTVQTMLGNHGTKTEVITGNVANEQNADYSRRIATTTTTLFGGAYVTVQRAQDYALLRQSLSAISQDSAQEALTRGLKSVSDIFGGNEQPFSPSTYLNSLYKSLSDYAAKPSDTTLAAAAISKAQDVARSLNDATTQIQQIRADADKEIQLSVTKLNDLLAQFQVANDAVKSATASGTDPNNAMDVREGLLKQISEIVGVNVLRREPNDLVLYTNEGTTLFEASPRTVTFSPTLAYGPTTVGSGIKIDGVPVQAGTGSDTTARGKLASLLQFRDQVTPTFQKQLDEVARGLIQIFAEDDGGAVPVIKSGLFTDGTITVPPGGTLVPGLAALIRVNPAVVPSLGGTPSKLRDGSINAGFNKNIGNNASFATVLQGYTTGLNSPIAFDGTAQLDSNASLLAYSTKSIGWLEAQRSSADTAATNKEVLRTHATEAYSNATGVTLDDEMALSLDLQQSYKATSQILNAIDEMLQSLLNAVG